MKIKKSKTLLLLTTAIITSNLNASDPRDKWIPDDKATSFGSIYNPREAALCTLQEAEEALDLGKIEQAQRKLDRIISTLTQPEDLERISVMQATLRFYTNSDEPSVVAPPSSPAAEWVPDQEAIASWGVNDSERDFALITFQEVENCYELGEVESYGQCIRKLKRLEKFINSLEPSRAARFRQILDEDRNRESLMQAPPSSSNDAVSHASAPPLAIEDLDDAVSHASAPPLAMEAYEDQDQVPAVRVVNSVPINNIDSILRDVLETNGEKLVVLDMDEFLLGRVDGTRNRVLLNTDLVNIVRQMRHSGADVIVVSQSSEDTINSRINNALRLAGFNETFDDLFSAGLCSQDAPSKAVVIMNYISGTGSSPRTIFFGDDTLEHLTSVEELIQGPNLNLYHFNDERILHFNAVEQYQAMNVIASFAEAADRLRTERGASAYLQNDLSEDRAVSEFAERARTTYQDYMVMLGLTTQREVVELLRVQNGFDVNDKTQDTQILRRIWGE